MFLLSIGLFLTGIVLIFVSSKNSNQQLRKIGTGLLIASLVVFALQRFDIPLGPSN